MSEEKNLSSYARKGTPKKERKCVLPFFYKSSPQLSPSRTSSSCLTGFFAFVVGLLLPFLLFPSSSSSSSSSFGVFFFVSTFFFGAAFFLPVSSSSPPSSSSFFFLLVAGLPCVLSLTDTAFAFVVVVALSFPLPVFSLLVSFLVGADFSFVSVLDCFFSVVFFGATSSSSSSSSF